MDYEDADGSSDSGRVEMIGARHVPAPVANIVSSYGPYALKAHVLPNYRQIGRDRIPEGYVMRLSPTAPLLPEAFDDRLFRGIAAYPILNARDAQGLLSSPEKLRAAIASLARRLEAESGPSLDALGASGRDVRIWSPRLDRGGFAGIFLRRHNLAGARRVTRPYLIVAAGAGPAGRQFYERMCTYPYQRHQNALRTFFTAPRAAYLKSLAKRNRDRLALEIAKNLRLEVNTYIDTAAHIPRGATRILGTYETTLKLGARGLRTPVQGGLMTTRRLRRATMLTARVAPVREVLDHEHVASPAHETVTHSVHVEPTGHVVYYADAAPTHHAAGGILFANDPLSGVTLVHGAPCAVSRDVSGARFKTHACGAYPTSSGEPHPGEREEGVYDRDAIEEAADGLQVMHLDGEDILHPRAFRNGSAILHAADSLLGRPVEWGAAHFEPIAVVYK